jgi:hypothetical protein
MRKFIITKFGNFINEDFNKEEDVFRFLASLKNPDLNEMINNFISSDAGHIEECIEDILLEIGNLVDDKKYNWVSKKLEELNPYKKKLK